MMVCSLGGDGEIGDELRKLGVPVFDCQPPAGTGSAAGGQAGRAWSAGERVEDRPHPQRRPLAVRAAWPARLAGAQVCHTEHSNLFPGQRALKRAERVLGRLSKAVICDGEDVRRQLVDEQKLSPRNVVTIHNGVDTELYGSTVGKADTRASGRRALGLADDTPVLATVARLEPVKDQATLAARVREGGGRPARSPAGAGGGRLGAGRRWSSRPASPGWPDG